MELKKIEIISEMAHFKSPMRSKIQQTYNIPPISSVVGILQNIYGEKIDNFIIGYTIEYDSIEKEFLQVYKEVNPNVKTLTCGERFKNDQIIVENLINPRLIIYTDINDEIKLDNPLVLGKTNYLAKINLIKKIILEDKEGFGYRQYTSLDIGDGMIRRINTLTKYNENKGYYDYKSSLVKENREFSYNKYFDEEEEQNIFLWRWKEGEIQCL